MKSLVVRILKAVLLGTLSVLAILLVFGIVLALNWPWWVGLFIILGLIGLGIGALFVRKLLARRKEQDFVGEIIVGEIYQIKPASILLIHNGNEIIFPKGEQIPKERYKKGDTIRATNTSTRECAVGKAPRSMAAIACRASGIGPPADWRAGAK